MSSWFWMRFQKKEMCIKDFYYFINYLYKTQWYDFEHGRISQRFKMDFYHSIIFSYKSYKIKLLLTLSISDYREWIIYPWVKWKKKHWLLFVTKHQTIYSVEIIMGHDNVRNQQSETVIWYKIAFCSSNVFTELT